MIVPSRMAARTRSLMPAGVLQCLPERFEIAVEQVGRRIHGQEAKQSGLDRRKDCSNASVRKLLLNDSIEVASNVLELLRNLAEVKGCANWEYSAGSNLLDGGTVQHHPQDGVHGVRTVLRFEVNELLLQLLSALSERRRELPECPDEVGRIHRGE